MSTVVASHGPELDQILEQAQARFDVLKRVNDLRQQRSELARQVAVIDHDLKQFEEPLRVILEERAGGAYRSRFPVPRVR